MAASPEAAPLCIAVATATYMAVQASRTKPDHDFFPIHDLEGEVWTHLNHDHVNRIGSDVDGGYAHAAGN